MTNLTDEEMGLLERLKTNAKYNPKEGLNELIYKLAEENLLVYGYGTSRWRVQVLPAGYTALNKQRYRAQVLF